MAPNGNRVGRAVRGDLNGISLGQIIGTLGVGGAATFRAVGDKVWVNGQVTGGNQACRFVKASLLSAIGAWHSGAFFTKASKRNFRRV